MGAVLFHGKLNIFAQCTCVFLEVALGDSEDRACSVIEIGFEI